MKTKLILLTSLLISAFTSYGQQTETQYLSGTGLGKEKIWKFYCTDGRNSRKWSTIKVPSQWELQGFGEYTYGRWYKRGLKNPSMEQGLYEYSFSVPAAWAQKQVSIVFEGVMTDTEVKINGQLAGAVHQGGFYEFSYDISDKLKYGSKNKLEVKVSKHSDNKSVNGAERRADWWLFGGIYRPVYLEAKPQQHIAHLAIDAQMDGHLNTTLRTTSLPEGYSVQLQLAAVADKALSYPSKNITLKAGITEQTVQVQWDNIRNWTPETPNLYVLTLQLRDAQQRTVHEISQRIGFRTVEFRRHDGIYVNNVRIVMKGTNRHSFYPDGGRTTNRQISLEDARLLKAMNMNAVRSHYPPDKHFLEMCDSLGLFYLDELAGWQNAYDTETGTKLVKETVERDVNHPCIVLWNNGNEGGWNTKLDKEFAKYDPQGRHVIHPWADFDGIDTHHYPAYQTGIARFTNGSNVFMPTEFAHGLYDQGNGAGMEDFWLKYTESPLFAGGFTWAFVDEAVKRSDRKDSLDSDGFNAPDGILGPYRQKEGSYYTIREIWSPVQLKAVRITPSFDGKLLVTNKYLYNHLGGYRLQYTLSTIGSPQTGSIRKQVKQGTLTIPDIAPDETTTLHLPVDTHFFEANILDLIAFTPTGDTICNWAFPIQTPAVYTSACIHPKTTTEKAGYETVDSLIVLHAGGVKVSFSTLTGLIKNTANMKGAISFNNGPIAVGMKTKFKEYNVRMENNKAVFTAFYLGGVDSIRWEMQPDGLLQMKAMMLNRASGGTGFDDSFMEENITNLGLTFSYPEQKVTGMQWMGRGPYRVWKNRIKGANYGLWDKAYNNTITGESFEKLIYPEFKGYHANLYWATLRNKESDFSVYSETENLFFRVFTPEEPHYRQNGENTMPDFPAGDLSFLYEIPAIRDFKPIAQLGPNSQPASVRIKKGDEGISMKLWFDFR